MSQPQKPGPSRSQRSSNSNFNIEKAAAWIGVLGIVVALAVYFADQRHEIQRIAEKLEAQTKTVEQQGQSIDIRLTNVDSQLKTVLVHVAAMCKEAIHQRWCRPADLAVTSRAVINYQARSLSGAAVKLSGPVTQASPTYTKALATAGFSVSWEKMLLPTEDIVAKLAAAAAAKDAQWTVVGGNLQATFENGEALFTPKAKISKMQLIEAARDMNTLSSAIKATAALPSE